MRNAVKSKLHSQAGASLLIALLFFLVALMVGTVVLTAAATNAGRLARSRQEQQTYLAVSSAALLVKEDFRGTAFTVGYQAVTTKTTETFVDEEGNPHTYVTTTGPVYSETIPVLTGDGKLLEGAPADSLAQLYYSTVPVLNVPAPGEMKYDLKITAENLPDVLGSMEAAQTDSARYTVTVKLYAQTEDGASANAMTLHFVPTVSHAQATTVSSSGNTETTTTTYTTTITWDTPTVTKGAAA